MAMTSARLGRIGEQLASRYLERHGLTILDRNWRCQQADVRGELDLVAREGDTVVFCEVKTRRRADAVDPLEAVTPQKVAQLRRLAGLWLAEQSERHAELRLDVVAVWWPTGGGRPQVAHVRGVDA
jgi:putative endonuclease